MLVVVLVRDAPRTSRPRGVVPHSLRIATWDDYARLHAAELSRGGAFLPTKDPLPVATMIMLCLRLPDGGVVEIAAEVKNVVSAARAATGKKIAGMGVRFVEFTRSLQEQLAALVPRGSGEEPPSVAAPVDDARSQRLAQALGEYREQLEQGDYFSGLGVPAEALENQVREAFRSKLVRLHPSRFALESEPVRRAATEVFLVLKRMHETLSSPVHAAAYRAQLDKPVQRPMDDDLLREIGGLRKRG